MRIRRAISPVVGVVLMVAIVVILAGITAAFVFESTEETDPLITGDSDIYGTTTAESGTKIDGDSCVRGNVVVHGSSLSLDTVDIDGHVYASDSNFPSSCPDTTIGPDEENCGEYDPRDPDDAPD